ncbi:MAG: sulfatase-like hydrolase/transferase, partial [Steroidobacteraceae bacterium]|nr:sulfatase-like hydrolase/transferase [Steroidobacteraceae bacterium]
AEPLGPLGGRPRGLARDPPTLPARLRDLGYRTAMVGQWHLGEPPENGPLRFGYHSYFGIVHGGADYFTHRANFGGAVSADGLYRDDKPTQATGYLTDLLGDEAVNIVRQSRQPLFVSLHFTAPHFPWQGPGDRATSASLRNIFHHDGGTVEKYREMLRSLDDNVGKVLAALDETGFAEDTLVIFTSDNGGERFSDTWPLTGLKGELLEGGIRVPLILRWPRRIAANRLSGQVMATMDFMPTLLAAAGAERVPQDIDGENLLPVLVGAAPVRERTLFWRHTANDQAAVRQGRWKYLRLGGKEHLFDIVQDPRERARLNDHYPDKLAELKELYAAWNARMLPPDRAVMSADVRRDFPDRY